MPFELSIVERAAASITVLLAMYGGVTLFTILQRRRLSRHKTEAAHDAQLPTGTPRLLYFWTEECAPCRAQEREINLAKKRLEVAGVHLAVDKMNAHREELFAERFNIMTVPTTVLLDSNGVVVGWNPGLTRANRLFDQVTKSLPETANHQAA